MTATIYYIDEETAGDAAVLYRGRLKYVGGRFGWAVTFNPLEAF